LDSQTNITLGHFEGHLNVALASSGTYAIGTDRGELDVADLATGTITTYIGHGVPLTAVVGPTPEWPLLASADSLGAIRVWPVPRKLVKVVAQADIPFMDVLYTHSPRAVIASNRAP